MQGVIFDVQRFSVHDGPGIRTTVFCKGCSLRCTWCHNPEGLSPAPGAQFFAEECLACGACHGRRDAAAASLCPTGALRPCGRTVEAAALVDELMADRAFFGTEGGVTFSGGECMLQADFVAACAAALAERGVATVIDTAGHAPWAAYLKTLPVCRHYLYDLKCADPARHLQHTGQDNRLILSNLARLAAAGARLWIRVPVIPGVNDEEGEMHAIAAIAAGTPGVERVTLMPYHTLGKSKYQTLGLTPGYEAPYPLSGEALAGFQSIFRTHGLHVE